MSNRLGKQTMTHPAATPNVEQRQRELLSELAMHVGSLERVRHWTKRFIYTPGVEHLAQAAGAHWLLDAIASLCRNPNLRDAGFQVWTLTVNPSRSAALTVTDGDEVELLRHAILYTDFPLDQFSLWLIDGTLLLPSEY
ncbi:MAG TPA: hypothetical protein VJY39_21220 [Acidisphaera sp.]|nr:hypothetical protein [Acidisphaera sp.]